MHTESVRRGAGRSPIRLAARFQRAEWIINDPSPQGGASCARWPWARLPCTFGAKGNDLNEIDTYLANCGRILMAASAGKKRLNAAQLAAAGFAAMVQKLGTADAVRERLRSKLSF